MQKPVFVAENRSGITSFEELWRALIVFKVVNDLQHCSFYS